MNEHTKMNEDSNNMPNFTDAKHVKLPTSLKRSLLAGALLCLMSVLVGAFAAHGLKVTLAPSQLDIVQTGAKYQMYHGLAMLICAVFMLHIPNIDRLAKANIAFLLGGILFSGSLYVLALTQIRMVAIITPIGGLCFLSGWCIFIWAILTSPSEHVRKH